MHATIDIDSLSGILSNKLGETVHIKDIHSVGGGSISSAYQVLTTKKSFFLKINESRNADVMFKAEVNGLKVLRKLSTFSIPEIITQATLGYKAILVMELIEPASRKDDYWQTLGIKLAELHNQRHREFGFSEDNFIGSLPQTNTYETDWQTFFIHQRITPMIKMAVDSNLLNNLEKTSLESALLKITDLMPIEPPSLLHGDLWSGNLLINRFGEPCLIDPAVYYGHREMDIAFSHLFGGFNQQFYKTYQEMYPLEAGFTQRIDLYNLYPLLVHLNLFGRSYIGQINSVISRFT